MSLLHYFDVFAEDEISELDNLWDKMKNSQAKLHDDVVSYIYDTLRWIPSYRRKQEELSNGINRSGITIFRIDGAPLAQKIFEKWADLFALGPEDLDLTGSIMISNAMDERFIGHARLAFKKQKLVRDLRSISALFEQCAAGNGKLAVLHYGI